MKIKKNRIDLRIGLQIKSLLIKQSYNTDTYYLAQSIS